MSEPQPPVTTSDKNKRPANESADITASADAVEQQNLKELPYPWVRNKFTRTRKTVTGIGTFITGHPIRSLTSAVIAGVTLFWANAAYQTSEADHAPSFNISCAVTPNLYQAIPNPIYFANSILFIKHDKPGVALTAKGELLKLGKTYDQCTIENIGHPAYDITLPVNLSLAPTRYSADAMKFTEHVHIDRLVPTEPYTFAIADLSPSYVLRVHIGATATARSQGEDKLSTFPIRNADSEADVYSFDVADMTRLAPPHSLLHFLESPAVQQHLIVIPSYRNPGHDE